MWVRLKRVLIFFVLLLYRWRTRDKFVQDVARNCKKRRYRKHVPGITEELEEVSRVPDDCRDDTSFYGFSRNGDAVVFKLTSMQSKEHTNVSIELPDLGRFKYSHTRPLNSGTGNLHLEMLEPMRRWKVSFRGTMKKLVSGIYSERVHVTVSMYWQCIADPFDHWTCASSWQLARNLGTESWGTILQKLSERRVRYEQWGELRGSVRIEGQDDRFVRFKGFRSREIADRGQMTRRTVVSHHAIVEGGKLFLMNGCDVPQDEVGEEVFGYVTYPLGERLATDQLDLDLVSRESSSSMALRYPMFTQARGISYNVNNLSMKPVAIEADSAVFKTITYTCKFTINGDAAYGISVVETTLPEDMRTSADENVLKQASESGNVMHGDSSSRNKVAIQLQSEDCMNARLVGGKGANLAVLRGMRCQVPNALCITTKALESQVKCNEQLKKASRNIERAIGNKSLSDLPRICSEAVQLYREVEITQTAKEAIIDELKTEFGSEFESKSFAVRSSGVSEDGKETSVAGQMDTFLAVKGLDQIMMSVRKCWASSLAYPVVEYRRQNGQPVIDHMAVVIQEMVNAEVAGVLFTNDPLTGNSCSLVINATPGLGEMVVSGKTDPDTIWVSRETSSGDLEIRKTTLGKKPVRMSMATSGDGVDEIRNDESSEVICLSNDQILELCRIGLDIEEHFGCPQDIEWALPQGGICILQSRPITSLLDETEEELVHEFDTPIALDTECLTTCNIGEMCPGATTPLTRDAFVRGLNEIFVRVGQDASGYGYPKYPDKCIGTCAGRPFNSLTAACVVICGNFLMTKNDVEVFVLGQALEEHTTATVEACMGRPASTFDSMRGMLSQAMQARKQVKLFDEWANTLDTFSIGEDASSATGLYDAIDEVRHIYLELWYGYTYKIQAVPFSMIMNILRGRNTSVSTENSSDLSILLANCKNVYSADVPTSIAELAKTIAASSVRDEFLALPDERCHSFLMGSENSIRTKYESFLTKHGHRCIKEVDFKEKSWAADPSKLMVALKPLVTQTTHIKEHEEMTNREIVELLRTPLSRFQKFLITNVLLDRAKSCVASREFGKSVTIKTIDVFKRAYWRLADLMVRESRLPEDDLLFFLTHREIGTLLETRSVSLVQKAKLRRRVFPAQEAVRFPKISFGPMVRLPEKPSDASNLTSLCLKGMPVGKGAATGRACVVQSLADAGNIQRGDILICPFTDVGWSPYFSMIAGLVTEMGGLISHGAVVAREVGIPCVVNVTDATVLFQTGDTVRIDGLRGVCERLVE